MNDSQNIKRLLLPAIKGLPFILIVLVISLMIASRVVKYKTPVYESTLKLKLDDKTTGFSGTNLFKDFDLFTNENKILTEAEVLKSRELIRMTAEKLDFDVDYFREGKIRRTEMYHESPFIVEYAIFDSRIYEREFMLKIHSDSTYELSLNLDGEQLQMSGQLGQPLKDERFFLMIKKRETLFSSRSNIDLADQYSFKVHTMDHVVEQIHANLDIKEVDKDIAVIRISYKTNVPEKAATLVNILAQTYIQDYVVTKSGAAKKTVEFIDARLEEISSQLQNSEFNLEKFKLDNKVVNTIQETETGLREISQLRIQLNNLIIKKAALDSLYEYINTDDKSFLELAPQVSFGDLLYTELVKKLKDYYSEKEDLLLLYTPNEDKVKAVDRKIEDIVRYIKESIVNAKKDVDVQMAELQQMYDRSAKVFDNLPTREKEQLILEREFTMNQNIYNFLKEKRMEAAIAEASTMAFHRIIEYGAIPDAPISPKKNFLLIVSAFLAVVFSLVLIYMKEFFNGKVMNRHELEKASGIPVVGIVPHFRKKEPEASKSEAYSNLAGNIIIKNPGEGSQLIVVTSTIRGEGKTSLAVNLAKAYAGSGRKVLLVDMDLRSSQVHRMLQMPEAAGTRQVLDGTSTLAETIRPSGYHNLDVVTAGQGTMAGFVPGKTLEGMMQDLRGKAEMIILDSPATGLALDGVTLMKHSDLCLYVVRANFTRNHLLLNPDFIHDEYGIENISLILNDTHKATNYNGVYTGSTLSYSSGKKGLFGWIKHYLSYYL